LALNADVIERLRRLLAEIDEQLATLPR